jgi:AcrR family transcriptional regulator
MNERPLGLRQRKRLQTRQHISDVATRLFAIRGFDAVTVAEVAEAANVSKMTVFNYFPRKEDLFFDRGPELERVLTHALRNRPADQPPLAALRALLLDLVAQRHPLGGVGDTFASFWRVVLESPTLQARAREALGELEDLLAALLGEAWGLSPDDSDVRLVAALTLAGYRTVYVTTVRRLLAGEDADAVAGDHMRQLNVAFDAIDRAVADLGSFSR